jgi:hypothetical protein
MNSSDDIPFYGFFLIVAWECLPTFFLLLSVAKPTKAGRKRYFSPKFGIYSALEENGRRAGNRADILDSENDGGENPLDESFLGHGSKKVRASPPMKKSPLFESSHRYNSSEEDLTAVANDEDQIHYRPINRSNSVGGNRASIP